MASPSLLPCDLVSMALCCRFWHGRLTSCLLEFSRFMRSYSDVLCSFKLCLSIKRLRPVADPRMAKMGRPWIVSPSDPLECCSNSRGALAWVHILNGSQKYWELFCCNCISGLCLKLIFGIGIQ